MSILHDLLHRPKSLWFRKALYQIHLWTGIGVGLYMALMGLTGALAVFSEDLKDALMPPLPATTASQQVLSFEAQVASVNRLYSGSGIIWVLKGETPRHPTEFWIQQESAPTVLLWLDSVTGKPIVRNSWVYKAVRVAVGLHFYLLAGDRGLLINAVGGALLLLLCITGLVVWWPGVKGWRRGLKFDGRAKWPGINWQLHNVTGIWLLPIIAMFAFTGMYLGLPEPFEAMVGAVAPLELNAPEPPMPPDQSRLSLDELVASAERVSPGLTTTWVRIPSAAMSNAQVYRTNGYKPHAMELIVEVNSQTGRIEHAVTEQTMSRGDRALHAFEVLHAGEFGGLEIKLLWALFGLALPFLFATAFLSWWNRVVSSRQQSRTALSRES